MCSTCFTLSVGHEEMLALRNWKPRRGQRASTLINFMPCVHFLTCQMCCVNTLRNKAELYAPRMLISPVNTNLCAVHYEHFSAHLYHKNSAQEGKKKLNM
jgi:hypothetical protein